MKHSLQIRRVLFKSSLNICSYLKMGWLIDALMKGALGCFLGFCFLRHENWLVVSQISRNGGDISHVSVDKDVFLGLPNMLPILVCDFWDRNLQLYEFHEPMVAVKHTKIYNIFPATIRVWKILFALLLFFLIFL